MLISFSGWLFFLLLHSIYAIVQLAKTLKDPNNTVSTIKICVDAYLIVVVLLHLPVVVMQVRL
jgi:hypothetical protein